MLASAAWLASCSTGEDLTLDENIEGYFLGESFGDFESRVGNSIQWTEIPSPPNDQRGTLISVTGTPSRSREIGSSRLTFVNDRLAEIVLYYKRTSYTQMETLRKRLEKRYGAKATSPDGSIEMAYKTYWIKAPGMSVTIRRITKKPETELYVQYQHDRLIGKKKEAEQ